VNTLTKLFPWAVVAVFTLYTGYQMVPKQETYNEYDLTAFGSIPVLDGGRIKPLDSVARTNMLFISGQSSFTDLSGDTQPAILWLLETITSGDPDTGPAADYRVFRIDNEQVLEELSLEYRPGSYRYSWKEVRKSWDRFAKALVAARRMDEKKRDLFHSKILELASRLEVYERLAHRVSLTLIPTELGSEKWETLNAIDMRAAQLPGLRDKALTRATREVDDILRGSGKSPDALTEAEQQRRAGIIQQLAGEYLRQLAEAERGNVNPAAGAFTEILRAYKGHRPKGFSEAIAAYKSQHVYPLHPEFRDTTAFEMRFNAAAPFFFAGLMYVFAAVFRALSWLGWAEPLRKASLGLACVALGLHVLALLGRMYLMDRPLVFVTNLYSSALMIGAGGVAACLYMERLFKNGVGLVVGTTLGAVTVKIAHHLSTDGNDTLGNLVAVLDTNLWLASHVTTVTLGYAATYIAGLLGVVYIAWGLFLTTLSKEKHIALGNMIYGTTCFATLLSFVGTVLGGIWADQSWGRFWGWDPKENGAVLIVIWNALILHARWAGIVKQRGMAVLAVVGIMVTTWSWFGTNQLGVGLHNYGFNKSLADGCRNTWIACLAVIALGLIPLPYWRSFSGTGQPRPEAAAARFQDNPNSKPAQPTDNAQTANNRTTGTQPKPGWGKGKKPDKRR
jgi:ABC-type transport system involved in cytochrome c biogenesis permease subunit